MNEEAIPITTDENGRDALGRFTPGNPGRPKGTGNKLKAAVQEAITEFLADKAPDLYTLYDTLEARDKLSLYVNLARLALPRPTETDAEREMNPIFKPIDISVVELPPLNFVEPLDFSRLTEEERAQYEALKAIAKRTP